MTDYARPNAQWSDLPGSATAMEPWRLVYSEAGTVVTVTLASGHRRRMEANFVLSDVEETEDGTVATWTLAEHVNGEVEAQIGNMGGIVHISG